MGLEKYETYQEYLEANEDFAQHVSEVLSEEEFNAYKNKSTAEQYLDATVSTILNNPDRIKKTVHEDDVKRRIEILEKDLQHWKESALRWSERHIALQKRVIALENIIGRNIDETD